MVLIDHQRRHKSKPSREKRTGRKGRQTDAQAGFPIQRLRNEEPAPENLVQHELDSSEAFASDQKSASQSDGEDETPIDAYGWLLSTLRAEQVPEPPRKRRRRSGSDEGSINPKLIQIPETGSTNGKLLGVLGDSKDFGTGARNPIRLNETTNAGGNVDETVDDNQDDKKEERDGDANAIRDEDEETEGAEDPAIDSEDLLSPFEHHFVRREGSLLADQIALADQNKWSKRSSTAGNSRLMHTVLDSNRNLPGPVAQLPSEGLKSRLHDAARRLWSRLSSDEKLFASSLLSYQDGLFGARTINNSPQLQELMSVHCLNHVLKTRDKVLKNNSRLAADSGDGSLEIRDQGFTRPKVLILLPTRRACVRFVGYLISLFEPEQQESRARFISSFAEAEEKNWSHKPEDFQDLFEGNDDDMFRIGIKFTRKTLKFFSKFYQSDIILASPLGLRTAIEGKGNKHFDADFLSSVEIALIDHADALLMQNWDNVVYIFSQLNLLPKASHDCDFSRVRTWYLDGLAKYFRQTIILSSFMTPDLTSLLSTQAHNLAGTLKVTPTYSGAIISPALPLRVPQTFIRFPSPMPQSDPSVRFKHFTSTILPTLRRPKNSTSNPTSTIGGTLIFIPSYFSYIPIRNHFSSLPDLSFTSLTEYTSLPDSSRERAHFATGRASILLYTERAHHFRRYGHIRGCGQVIFYGCPENPKFWEEVVGFLGDGVTGRKPKVKALFSKWDAMKLERVVGTERVRGMLSEGKGDVFEFF